MQSERARRLCKISVCGGHTTGRYICRYGEMKSIQSSHGNRHQPYEETMSFDRMPVFQRMYLKKTIDDVIFEVIKRTLLYLCVNVATAATTREQATQLDQRQATNRGRLRSRGEMLEFV